MKLGEVIEDEDGQRWILTSRYANALVWTPIPEGEDESGLGRTYKAAPVSLIWADD